MIGTFYVRGCKMINGFRKREGDFDSAYRNIFAFYEDSVEFMSAFDEALEDIEADDVFLASYDERQQFMVYWVDLFQDSIAYMNRLRGDVREDYYWWCVNSI